MLNYARTIPILVEEVSEGAYDAVNNGEALLYNSTSHYGFRKI